MLDQGLPHTTTHLLQALGWDVEHTNNIGMNRASDGAILDYARKTDRVCVTLDADFHMLLALGQATRPSVIRIRQEGLKAEDIVQLLTRICPKIANQVLQGALVTVTEKRLRIRQLPVVKDKESI